MFPSPPAADPRQTTYTPPTAEPVAAIDPALALGSVTLAQLLDETEELVCVTGGDGRVTYVNRAWRRALGYTAREAARMTAIDFVVPEHRTAYRDAARRLVAGHAVDGFEAVLMAKDGRRVVCRGRATPQMGPAGPAGAPPRCLGARAFYRDVTAERRTEAVRARLAATLEASPDYVAVKTRDGAFVYVNRAGRQLVGLAEDAPLDGLHGVDVHPYDEEARVADVILPAALRDGRWVGESALLGPTGEVVPVELTAVPHPSVREDDPTPYFISTIARDLRPRLAAEAALRASEARYRSLVDGLAEGVLVLNADGAITAWNASAERILGFTGAQLANSTTRHATWKVMREDGTPLPPDERPAMRTLRTGEAVDGVVMGFEHAGGSRRWIRGSSRAVYDAPGASSNATPGGSPPVVVATFADITNERAATQGRLELAAAVAMVPDGVSLTAADGTFTYVNAALAAIFGYDPGELIGRSWRMLHDDAELARLEGETGPALAATGCWTGEVTGLRRDGTRFPQELQLVRMPWGGMVSAVRDISARTAAARALEEQLAHDELTGLLNRRGFFARAAAALARAAREGAPCVLLYGDVDRFKQLNDTYGHAVGDDGLRVVAAALRAAARPDDLTARLGGDEFVALLVDADTAAADAVRDRLRRALAETPVVGPRGAPDGGGGAPVFVRASLGAAVQPAAGRDGDDWDGDDAGAVRRLERLLREADAALYAEKRGRR